MRNGENEAARYAAKNKSQAEIFCGSGFGKISKRLRRCPGSRTFPNQLLGESIQRGHIVNFGDL